MGRDDIIYDEVAALWRELYREPPPIKADGSMMLDIIMKSLPEERYERFATPRLRDADVVRPRPRSEPSPSEAPRRACASSATASG